MGDHESAFIPALCERSVRSSLNGISGVGLSGTA